MIRFGVLAAALALTALPLLAHAQDDDKAPGRPTTFACTLKPTDEGFVGDCGLIFPDTAAPVLKLRPAADIDGVWREDRLAQRVYKGSFVEGIQASTLALEIYPGGWGVLRTAYGWFPVTGFATTSSDLDFTLDSKHEVAPGPLDERILMRAIQISRQGADWNRKDNRRCEDTTHWSIYCAMDQATAEVTGAHDHRRPAMEVVRLLVEARTKHKAYAHRLMDYNNDPATTLTDVQSLFEDALQRVRDDDWLSEHDFVRPDGQGGFTPG
ncbi:MAG TPA: hypothetical protein VG407_02875 [Caulobacteraceae bacterium]|jgi:hypothetical protein|nr:hypothetical protein [Caulobacteraceae bacterium]